MNTFLLNISSPDGKVFSGDVTGLVVRGVSGDLMVLAGHVPFITNVKPGTRCAIHMPDGTVKEGTTDGGLLTVAQKEVTYLTAGIDWE
ncbi:MAG: F0F1 ATP synthase subunit epsilon [Clostridiales bacterium]|nr:F0F1 ATP synthase subunit epsilon [Clostridiales bacterium]